MSYFIHQLPGRLRVCAPAFNDPMHPAIEALRTQPGIKDVHHKPLARSVTICFDSARIQGATIITLLNRQGVLRGVWGLPVKSGFPIKNLERQTTLPWREIALLASKLVLPLLAERLAGKTARKVVAALI